MKYILRIAALCFILCISSNAYAQANAPTDTYNPGLKFDGEPRDSLYYMKDDGIFSDEEKDEEAMYIYQQCNGNYLRRLYYDCGCIAGQFRMEREAEKLVPQNSIINKVYNGRNTPCANTINIAGSSFEKCQKYSQTVRGFATPENNEEFCKCVANKVALDFTKTPSLNLRYVEGLQTKSILSCERTF